MQDIIETITNSPVTALVDTKAYEALYAHIKAEVETFVPDLSTDTGRKRIAALAYKVTRTKTTIDAAGKQLNEEARAKINAVDAQRRKIRDDLDALAAQARLPLTQWEQVEEARLAEAAAILTRIQETSHVSAFDSSETVGARLRDLKAVSLTEEMFRESFMDAEDDLKEAIERLTAAHDRLVKSEADAKELERLRAEAAEREAAEFSARQQIEADRREAERKGREEADAKRKEFEAIERIRAEERLRANEEIKKADDERLAAITAADRRDRERAEAEAARQAEDDRRAVDKRHRARVIKAAADALTKLGVASDLSEKIILAIGAGSVPNVTLRF